MLQLNKIEILIYFRIRNPLQYSNLFMNRDFHNFSTFQILCLLLHITEAVEHSDQSHVIYQTFIDLKITNHFQIKLGKRVGKVVSISDY